MEQFDDPVGSMGSSAAIRIGLQLLNPFGAEDVASPGPHDEIIGLILVVGGALYKLKHHLPYGQPTSYPYQSYPVTSTSGHSERRVKKQISSTSRSYSRRKKYEYGKKRRY